MIGLTIAVIALAIFALVEAVIIAGQSAEIERLDAAKDVVPIPRLDPHDVAIIECDMSLTEMKAAEIKARWQAAIDGGATTVVLANCRLAGVISRPVDEADPLLDELALDALDGVEVDAVQADAGTPVSHRDAVLADAEALREGGGHSPTFTTSVHVADDPSHGLGNR